MSTPPWISWKASAGIQKCINRATFRSASMPARSGMPGMLAWIFTGASATSRPPRNLTAPCGSTRCRSPFRTSPPPPPASPINSSTPAPTDRNSRTSHRSAGCPMPFSCCARRAMRSTGTASTPTRLRWEPSTVCGAHWHSSAIISTHPSPPRRFDSWEKSACPSRNAGKISSSPAPLPLPGTGCHWISATTFAARAARNGISASGASAFTSAIPTT